MVAEAAEPGLEAVVSRKYAVLHAAADAGNFPSLLSEEEIAARRSEYAEHVAGLGDPERKSADVGVGKPSGDGTALGQSESRGRGGGDPSGDFPGADDPSSAAFRREKPLEARVAHPQEAVRRIAILIRIFRLVRRQHIAARQLPGEEHDDPVARLDETVGGIVYLRRFVERLPDLGDEELARDDLPETVEPVSPALRVKFVYPVGVRLCGVMLPQLAPCVFLFSESVGETERSSVRVYRYQRAGGEIDARTGYVVFVYPRGGDHARDKDLQGLRVVGRVLERRAGREGLRRPRQEAVYDSVFVIDGGRGELTSV